MTLTYNFGTTYTDDLPAIKQDFSEVIYGSNPLAFPALALAKMAAGGKTIKSSTHYWREIAHTPFKSTLDGSINSSVTTVTFATKAFKTGESVRVNAETILLGSTSDNLTFTGCTRGVGSTSGAAHDDGAAAIGVGKAHAQNSSSTGTSDLIIEPQTVTSYTKITKRIIDVSGTAQLEIQHGEPMPRWQKEMMVQGNHMMREQERDLFYRSKAAPSGGSTGGSFDGYYERISDAGNTEDDGGNAVSLDSVRDAIKNWRGYEFGQPGFAMPVIFCSTKQKQYFDSLGDTKVYYASDPSQNAVVAKFGAEVAYLRVSGLDILIQELSWLEADMFMIDHSQVKYMPLANERGSREMLFRPLGVTTDGDQGQLVSENGLEFANPIAAGHYWYDVDNS